MGRDPSMFPGCSILAVGTARAEVLSLQFIKVCRTWLFIGITAGMVLWILHRREKKQM